MDGGTCGRHLIVCCPALSALIPGLIAVLGLSPGAFLSLGFGVPGVPGIIGVILDLSDLPISQSLLSERRELVCHLDRIDSLCLIDAQAQSSLTSNYQEILNYCGR